MLRLFSFLRFFDSYGSEIKWRYRHKEKFTSRIGGLFNIILYTILVYKIVDLFYKIKNNDLSVVKEYYDFRSQPFPLRNLSFSFCVSNSENYYINNFKLTFNSNKGYLINGSLINFKKCNMNEFNSELFLGGALVNSCYCLRAKNESLTSFLSNIGFSSLDNNLLNLKVEENITAATNHTKSLNVFNGFIIVRNSFFNYSDSNFIPIYNRHFLNFKRGFDTKAYISALMVSKESTYEIDSFIDNYFEGEKDTDIQFDDYVKVYDSQNRKDNSFSLNFAINLNPKVKYFRTVKFTIDNVLAVVGGTFQIIEFLLSLCITYYNEYQQEKEFLVDLRSRYDDFESNFLKIKSFFEDQKKTHRITIRKKIQGKMNNKRQELTNNLATNYDKILQTVNNKLTKNANKPSVEGINGIKMLFDSDTDSNSHDSNFHSNDEDNNNKKNNNYDHNNYNHQSNKDNSQEINKSLNQSDSTSNKLIKSRNENKEIKADEILLSEIKGKDIEKRTLSLSESELNNYISNSNDMKINKEKNCSKGKNKFDKEYQSNKICSHKFHNKNNLNLKKVNKKPVKITDLESVYSVDEEANSIKADKINSSNLNNLRSSYFDKKTINNRLENLVTNTFKTNNINVFENIRKKSSIIQIDSGRDLLHSDNINRNNSFNIINPFHEDENKLKYNCYDSKKLKSLNSSTENNIKSNSDNLNRQDLEHKKKSTTYLDYTDKTEFESKLAQEMQRKEKLGLSNMKSNKNNNNNEANLKYDLIELKNLRKSQRKSRSQKRPSIYIKKKINKLELGQIKDKFFERVLSIESYFKLYSEMQNLKMIFFDKISKKTFEHISYYYIVNPLSIHNIEFNQLEEDYESKAGNKLRANFFNNLQEFSRLNAEDTRRNINNLFMEFFIYDKMKQYFDEFHSFTQ